MRQLIWLNLRRDRVFLVVWIVLSTLLPVGVAAGSDGAYPDQATRDAFAASVASNPAELATRGPVFAPTVGSLTAWTVVASGAVLVGGLVSALFVVRWTRAEEQAGRRELLGSTVLDRRAPLAAALVMVVAADVVIGVLVAALLVAYGLPVVGSVALGAVYLVAGVLLAMVGAVAAQLVEAPGAARAIALVVLGAAFAVSAVGEVGRSWLVWVTPFGWARRVQAFAGERWWVLLLFVVPAAVLAVLAFALSARRDVGAGLVPARSGPAVAAPGLRGPLSLAWRLHRGTLSGWAVGLTALGVLLGSAMRSLGTQLDTPAFRALGASLGGGDPAEVFFRFVLYVLAQVVAASAVAAVLRMRKQETAGLADAVLAGPVTRVRWALGHLAVTASGAVLALVGLGLGAGVAYGTSLSVLATTLAYVPACLLFAAVAVALHGWVPRLAAPVTWTLLGGALVLDLLGEFRVVDRAVLALSPFVRTLTPLTAGSGLPGALAGLVLVTLALAAVGLTGLRRRDLA